MKETNLPLISVIIPVYNVKDYINQCIQSVLAQTYFKLQIILVDDGSPDGCGDICDKYKEQDSRVEVIHKPNGGLPSARNAGLKAVKGKYISFIDSDDYIADNMYEKMYGAIEKTGADYCECDYTLVYQDGSSQEDDDSYIDFSKLSYTKDELIALYVKNTAQGRWRVVWNKLYAAKLFENLSFDEHRKTGEDIFVNLHIQENVQMVALIPDKLNYYRQNPASITHHGRRKAAYSFFQEYLYISDFDFKHGGYASGCFNASAVGCLILSIAGIYPLNDAENKKRFDDVLAEFRPFFKKYFFKLFFSYSCWLTYLYLFPYATVKTVLFFDKHLFRSYFTKFIDTFAEKRKNRK